MRNIILLVVLIWSSNSVAQTNNSDSLQLWDNVNGYRVACGYFENLELEASFLITSYPQQEQGFGGMGM